MDVLDEEVVALVGDGEEKVRLTICTAHEGLIQVYRGGGVDDVVSTEKSLQDLATARSRQREKKGALDQSEGLITSTDVRVDSTERMWYVKMWYEERRRSLS